MRAFGAAVLLGVALSVAACGSTGSDAAPVPTTATTAGPTTTLTSHGLQVLVTNDDGYGAPGIDAVVEALRAVPDTAVTVVAPAANESGSGDATTPGAHHRRRVTTRSGYPAVSVGGTPADAVHVALGALHLRPDLVVSGANRGQNIGPITRISGTVGAARTAARSGIPALAASTGNAAEPDYAGAAALVAGWVRDHRAELVVRAAPARVLSLNVPTCPAGSARRGVVEAPTATGFHGRNPDDVRCDSTVEPSSFHDDVDAFLNGYAVFSPVPT